MGVLDKVRYLTSQPAFQAEPMRVLGRLGWWWLRSRTPRPATIRLRGWGIRLELPPRWRGVAKVAYAFRERYERELMALPHLVREGWVAVDVGASYGIYACVLARLVGPTGKVYAFEPAEEAFSVLQRNVKRNRLEWVDTYRSACADAAGEGFLRHEDDPSRNALEVRAPGASPGEPVGVVRLDDVVPEADFIKMDVEGAEELVLRGAAGLLERSRPIVMFEVNHEAARRLGRPPDGAWRLLEALGYRFLLADPEGRLTTVTELPPGGNVFALPGD